MEILGMRAGAHKAHRALAMLVGTVLLIGAHVASAQTPASNPADQAPSEAARRAALSPYRFILQNATAPARRPAPKPAESTTAAVAEPKRPAPAPVQHASVEPQAPAAQPAAAPTPAPQPEPAVAALSRKPVEPPPPKRDIIPIRTDEPRLPPALLREQPHGVVKVQFDIEPDGSVGDVKVVSSTNRSLNKATIEAVQGWKFQPVDEILTVQTEVDYKLDE